MAPTTTYLSILSLFLIPGLNAQTGKLCLLKTCNEPGQVRIDAVVNAHGEFERGCNCACPPSMYDGSSPDFCDPLTHQINFDENTLLGDCSCSCLGTAPDPSSCIRPSVWNPKQCSCGCPPSSPDPTSCVPPHEFRPSSCLCGCEQGDIGGPCIMNGRAVDGTEVTPECTCDVSGVICPGNQIANPVTTICECPLSVHGAFLPECELPTVRDPITCDCVTTTAAPVPPPTVPVPTSTECNLTPQWVPDALSVPPIERDTKSCAFGTTTITNPANNYWVACSASGSCYDATINMDITATSNVEALRGFACTMVGSCMNAKINVNDARLGGNPIPIGQIQCTAQKSCEDAVFTFATDVIVETGDVFCGWGACKGCTINGNPCSQYTEPI